MTYRALISSIVVLAGACTSAPLPEAPVVAASDAVAAVDMIELRDADLYANFFPVAGRAPGPAIILLGGSEGGLNPAATEEARLLRDEGFSVLQLSFYKSPGQPGNLEMVPLETFDRGLDWLAARAEVDPARIGIFGTSKGAEAALITGVRHPDGISAIVAVVPSSVSWQGINWDFDGRPPEASWSLEGAPYPALPYGEWDQANGLYSLYANGLKAVDAHEEALIRIEETKAPVLLICGEADTLWPSCPMSEALIARAKAFGGPEIDLLAYPEVGHGAGGAPLADFDPARAEEALSYGGTRGASQAAREDGWPKTLAFLKAALE